MTQERGSKAQVLLDFETTFGSDPGSAAAYRMPINSFGVKSEQARNTAQTITGRRDPAEPFAGNIGVSGSAVVPLCARGMFYWLKALFGSPSTAAGPTTTLDAGAAVNNGSGKVGLPCTAHGYTAGDQVKIAGTSNYNDVYTLDATTSTNELVITETYAAETFDGSETVTPCIEVNPDAGAATDEGGGLVGIPSTAHGLPVGGEVTIAGTTNYNGTYTVERGTTANKILITDSYVAETFDGAETILALFHQHTFTVGDTMPSLVLEKGFTTNGYYAKCNGSRVSSAGVNIGGDGELVMDMGIEGASETIGASPYDSSPVITSADLKRFANFRASLLEGGSTLSNGVEASFSINMGLDTDQYLIGAGGVRGDLPEGTLELSGNLVTLFEDTTLLDKAINNTESSILFRFVRGHYRLDFEFEEILYGRNFPSIEGPQGVRVDLPWQAYYGAGSNDSAVQAVLVTDIKTYE